MFRLSSPVADTAAFPLAKIPVGATVILLFWRVILSLSEPDVPGVEPPTEMPYPIEVAIPVLILQFLIVLFVAPALVPRLITAITVGAVVFVFVMVKLRSVEPLLLPSMMTLSDPFNLIRAPLA